MDTDKLNYLGGLHGGDRQQNQHPNANLQLWRGPNATNGDAREGGIPHHPYHDITPMKLFEAQRKEDSRHKQKARIQREQERKEADGTDFFAAVSPSSQSLPKEQVPSDRSATLEATPPSCTSSSPPPPPPLPSSSPTTQLNSPPGLSAFSGIVGHDYSSRYHLSKPIGKGSFSAVWLMTHVLTGKIVVGKFMNLGTMSSKNRRFALNEAENAAKCYHPNIIRFYEKFKREDFLLLIFEHANAGDLFAQVTARKLGNKPFRENEILLVMTQLLLAVAYLHDRNIMHRDLKSPNVFLTTSGLIKLGDFGFSRQYDGSLSEDVGVTFCGTPYYLAPELWAQNTYSEKADVWSLGVILFELMALSKPFDAKDMRGLIRRVMSGEHAPIPTTYSEELATICRSMLEVDPRDRPTVRDILSYPIFIEGGLKLLRNRIPKLTVVPDKIKIQMIEHIDDFLNDSSTKRTLGSIW